MHKGKPAIEDWDVENCAPVPAERLRALFTRSHKSHKRPNSRGSPDYEDARGAWGAMPPLKPLFGARFRCLHVMVRERLLTSSGARCLLYFWHAGQCRRRSQKLHVVICPVHANSVFIPGSIKSTFAV